MVTLLGGLMAGMIHVLAGPDHLAAVAPLALRGRKKGWAEGVRWGLGHSAGVGMVGVLALVLRELLPVELISGWSERLVGVLLIGIGIWAFRKALQVHSHAHDHGEGDHVHIHIHSRKTPHESQRAHVHHHAAFGIGALHGLAGSSHFLGILPALALPTKFDAVVYLLAFAAGTVIAMTSFSSLIGLVAGRFSSEGDRVYRGLMYTCSLAAVAVGGFWLVM